MKRSEQQARTRRLVLFVGRVNDPAWKDQVPWLREACELVCCATIAAAEHWLAGTQRFPVMVIFSQPRRDFYVAADIKRLMQLLPMAHLVSLEGSWCEGASRSGQPYEGLQRCYWYQFRPRMANLLGLDVSSSGKDDGGLLNGLRTETENERVIAASKRALPSGSGLLGIAARDLVTYDSLDQACRLAGYRTSWLRSGTVDVPLGLRAIVVDVDDVLEAEVLLNQLPAEAAAIPCVVLAHFPRLADVKRLSSDGRTTVVAKPFRLHDLLWLLAESIEVDRLGRAA
jgi:hypothetical protein